MTERSPTDNPERQRLEEDDRREHHWSLWGPYLAERQWGTVREDYSPGGQSWTYFTHDHARSRAYRWGEDGLLGITDRECRICFALALWNERDPILKERLFGVTGPEGNHGEDVKELYYYLDATPSGSYLAALYKYPQREFPYADLIAENARRGREEPEYDIEDTGIFDENRYFDVLAEYAKASPTDVLIRITISNRGPDAAPVHLLPTIWQRNTWAWGRQGEGYWPRGHLGHDGLAAIAIDHPSLGRYRLDCEAHAKAAPRLLFTENETHRALLYDVPNTTPYVKDAFHRLVVEGDPDAVNPEGVGTKAAAWYRFDVPAGGEVVVRLRLRSVAEADGGAASFGPDFDALFELRKREADRYYLSARDEPLSESERHIVRQADAGLMWSKQFYHYIVEHWLDGDPNEPPPRRHLQRNHTWRHFWARDILAMPDKWEYPWFAAWDTAFHCVAMARIDPAFAKAQLLLLCREWYMHPNGQLPAYEFVFQDVNPPVHAWAVWRVYQFEAQHGRADRLFLERAFQKCLINFTWWVNRADVDGDNLFTGGFLGLDNIGVFDRSNQPLGGRLEQADATAWMAFYCTTMLAMALELSLEDPAYGDVATKFFEHFVLISKSMNELGGSGLWDEHDGFYYDVVFWDGHAMPLRIRSMVGLIPLFAVETLHSEHLARHPLFRKRMQWFLDNRPELASTITCLSPDATSEHRLLALPSRHRLEQVLRYVFDEDEFLSPYGVRSLSRHHKDHPYVLHLNGEHCEVRYTSGESTSGLFGGNSNWRGPVWFPVNYLLIEALKRFHHFYGETLKIECPTGSGRWVNLLGAAEELERRLCALFLPNDQGQRPCHGRSVHHARDPHCQDLVLFHEYFDGDDGRGLGASHQTGWTALAANLFERVAAVRARDGHR